MAIPPFIAFTYYYSWKNSPSRLEEESKKHTWALYEEAKTRHIGTLDIDKTFDYFIGEVPPENQETYLWLKQIFVELWRYEGYETELQLPPPACNSIEGGKYRDYLNKVDHNRPALMRVALMANIALKLQSFNQELVKLIGEVIIAEENGKVYFPKTAKILNENFKKTKNLLEIFDHTVIADLKNLKSLIFNLPDELRTSHHHIVAGSGSGKTQALQQLILNDLKDDVAIVVIDSQGDFINKLATRIDPERLILIDPEYCPPALNLFSKQESEKQIATAIELYEYIFSSLDADMTSKQQTAYRFVSRLLMTVPKANIHTMREILEPKGSFKYQKYIDELGETAKSFFFNEFESKQFAETKQQILRRLYTVLENQTMEKMLGATDSKLNIGEALDSGKVVLVSTAKSFLKQTGASLIGRIFIAQVMQAVMSRGDKRKRTYLYIDEFQDYAEDSHVLFNLFEQARKYNLGLIVSHQYLGQLPPKLQQSISANTAIKFARGVSAEDARTLAKQMFTTPEFIQNQGKGDFACYLKGQETSSYHVEFGKLERTPEISSLSSIRDNMLKQYGVPSPTEVSPEKPYIEPQKGQGSGEVVEEEEADIEQSKW
ncbi:type IV secretion system DNA-binding domain-containing protein [Nitrosomonas sp.]|uniref:type IV secretory system conjugative DNA transfer family protein n=1 Tax=Nitrosomonas sp. TaxID=42353 RepID=UPI0032EE0F0E